MTAFDGPSHEMDRDLSLLRRSDPLRVDDGTADRLLSGTMAPDDAPPAYQAVAALFAALTAGPSPAERLDEGQSVTFIARRLAQGAASSPTARTSEMNRGRRLRVAAATLMGSVTLFAGLASANALPSAAQAIASDMLRQVGVSVPNPSDQSDGHPHTRGTSDDAATVTAIVTTPGSPTSSNIGGDTEAGMSGKGSAVSQLVESTPATGVDTGATISSAASDGKSQAGSQSSSAADGGSSSGPSTTRPVSAPPEIGGAPSSTPSGVVPPVSSPPTPPLPVTTPNRAQEGLSRRP